MVNLLPTPEKYRPEQITVKKFNTEIRSWRGKKLLQINVLKFANLEEIIANQCNKIYEFSGMKANFAEENFAIFVFWTMLYSNCKFSKYFWDC